MRWKLGEGARTRFWLDMWFSEECLIFKCPRLFLNLEQKEEVVGIWEDGRGTLGFGI